MLLTDDQHHLLAKINQYSETSRRTDKLSQCMTNLYGKVWDISRTPFIGLQLRALGYVTTFKDDKEYARWDITAKGKAALLQSSAERDKCKPQKEAPVTVPEETDYWVRCKGDNTFKAYSSYGLAEAEARKQAAGGRTPEIYAVRKVATVTQIPAHFEVIKP